jgi:hypothetical protein
VGAEVLGNQESAVQSEKDPCCPQTPNLEEEGTRKDRALYFLILKN